jgi:hypothetical protein
VAEDGARPVVHGEMDAQDEDKIRSFSRAMCNWQIADGPIAAVDAGIGGAAERGVGARPRVSAGRSPRVCTRALHQGAYLLGQVDGRVGGIREE